MQSRPTVYSSAGNTLKIDSEIKKGSHIVAVSSSTIIIDTNTPIDETVTFEVRMKASLIFLNKPSAQILKNNVRQSALGEVKFPENGSLVYYKTPLLKSCNYPFVNNAGTHTHLIDCAESRMSAPLKI